MRDREGTRHGRPRGPARCPTGRGDRLAAPRRRVRMPEAARPAGQQGDHRCIKP